MLLCLGAAACTPPAARGVCLRATLPDKLLRAPVAGVACRGNVPGRRAASGQARVHVPVVQRKHEPGALSALCRLRLRGGAVKEPALTGRYCESGAGRATLGDSPTPDGGAVSVCADSWLCDLVADGGKSSAGLVGRREAMVRRMRAGFQRRPHPRGQPW